MKNHEVLTPDELRTLELLQTGNITLTSRAEALAEIKKVLGISASQNPVDSLMDRLLVDKGTDSMLYPDTHQIVYTRGLIYDVSGQFNGRGEPITQVIIQEHSYGHIYGAGPGQFDGNQFSHFNVRPVDEKDSGNVLGVPDHFYFDRNTK